MEQGQGQEVLQLLLLVLPLHKLLPSDLVLLL